MSKPTTPPAEPATKKSTRFRMDAMPKSYQAAGKIIQILAPLNLDDAEVAWAMVNRMFGERKQLVDQPPHLPGDEK